MNAIRAIVTVVLLAGAAPRRAGGQPGPLPEGPPPTPRQADPSLADRLDAYSTVIRSAEDPAVAQAAFDRAVQVAPKDGPVHKTYMERMLRAGFDDRAARAAAVVVTASPGDGRGWALIARAHARSRRWPDAVSAAARSARAAPDDALVQASAGEVLAGYDLRPLGAATDGADRTQADSEAIRKLLAGRAGFVKAYAAAKARAEAPPGAPATAPAPRTDKPRPKPGRADRAPGSPYARLTRQATAEDRRLKQAEKALRRSLAGRRSAPAPTDRRDEHFYTYTGRGWPYLCSYGYGLTGWGPACGWAGTYCGWTGPWGFYGPALVRGSGLTVRGTFSCFGGKLTGRFGLDTGSLTAAGAGRLSVRGSANRPRGGAITSRIIGPSPGRIGLRPAGRK